MLTYKDIIQDDNPLLRQKSQNVALPLSQEDIDVLYLMNEYLINSYDEEACERLGIRPGVGISAVQVGVLKRMFIILGFDEEQNLHHYVVINPKIIAHSEQLTYLETGEGCLSVNREIAGLVHRPKRIRSKCHLFDFETKQTSETTLQLQDYMAIVFQHEYDHLSGKLFYDHINKEDPFAIPNNSTPVVIKTIEDNEETTSS